MSGTLGFPLQLTDPGNYWDLHIVDDDIALDVGRQPLKLADRASIAQDIAHMDEENSTGARRAYPEEIKNAARGMQVKFIDDTPENTAA